MRVSRLLWAPLSLVLLASTAPAAVETVEIGHNRIDPAELTVESADIVMFQNVDAMPGGHTIVADDGSFESPPLGKDESWSHTFVTPGSHPYHIKEHPSARGTITVE